MLPKELVDIFENYKYAEDDINLYVTRVDYLKDTFLIDFALDVQDINEQSSFSQRWTIEAKGHRKNHISFDFTPFIEMKDDHPLLWEFTDTQCQLYFAGQCKDPARLFYELYLTHKRTFAEHNCFNISFGEDFNNHFQYSNGLLTQGSKILMLRYAECLIQNGLDFTIIGERPAMYWDGKQNILEIKDLKVLFMGSTYVIAQDFSFVRQDKNSR